MRKILDRVAMWARTHSDKVLHFAVCTVLTSWLTLLLKWDIAVFVVFAVSAIKEAYDREFSRGDFLADCLGIAASGIPLALMTPMTM